LSGPPQKFQKNTGFFFTFGGNPGAGLMIGVEIAGAQPAVLTKRLVNGLRAQGPMCSKCGRPCRFARNMLI